MLTKMNMGWYFGLLRGILKVRVLHKSVPLMCHWEITYKCNLECVFCATRLNQKAWQPETTTARALEIVAQIAGMGTKILNIVGGEPTARKDLPEIIKSAQSLGIRVAVTTNGVINDEQRHRLLGADIIRVSLEGAPELNSRLRKSAGVFNSTAAAVNTLRFLVNQHKVPLIASTLSSQTRNDDINYLVGIARELGIKIVFNPIGIGFSEKRDGFTHADREERRRQFANIMLPIEACLARIAELHRLYPESIASGEPCLGILKMGGLEKFGCLAMDTAICIKPDGSVVIPCIEFPEVVEKNDDLRAIYYGKQAQQGRRLQGKYWFCEHCHLICMMMATSLVRLSPLMAIARQYLPQVIGKRWIKRRP